MALVDLNEMIKKPFITTQSDLTKYNGQDFEIIRELKIGEEVGSEVAPMFQIKFKDEFITDAFTDEIFTDESLDKIFTVDFLKMYRS